MSDSNDQGLKINFTPAPGSSYAPVAPVPPPAPVANSSPIPAPPVEVDNFNFELNKLPDQPFTPIDLESKKPYIPFSTTVIIVRCICVVLTLIPFVISMSLLLRSLYADSSPFKFIIDLLD